MLSTLYINNIVLIDELKLNFTNNLTVFTGQTGAGKSILLDSVALALGSRADFNLIKKNASSASVVAVFDVAHNHACINMLIQAGLLQQNAIQPNSTVEIIAKRILFADGKSKAFINDQPVSVTLLKNIGNSILDIHGQGDNHLLLNPSNYKHIVDKFLPNKNLITNVASAYNLYNNALQQLQNYNNNIKELQKEEEYLNFVYNELKELNLQPNEEEDLVEKKALYSNFKKIFACINNIQQSLEKEDVLKSINFAIKQASTLQQLSPNTNTANISNALEQAFVNTENALAETNNFANSFNINQQDVDSTEERLINIRSAAKKYKMSVVELYSYITQVQQKLETISKSVYNSNNLQQQVQNYQQQYINACNTLHTAREQTASNITKQVNLQLQSLMLKDAEFIINVNKLSIEHANSSGLSEIVFNIKTNKGGSFGLLSQVASGGEMARLMLALKIVFTTVDSINTIILDEIDIGVGGEVALAIGKSLQALAKNKQVIVVTHSHQVATCGVEHFKVIKSEVNNVTLSSVIKLNQQQRIQEIARMLSGATITDNALSIAKNMLLEHGAK